jgi:hypothetical protein
VQKNYDHMKRKSRSPEIKIVFTLFVVRTRDFRSDCVDDETICKQNKKRTVKNRKCFLAKSLTLAVLLLMFLHLRERPVGLPQS